MKGSVTRLIYKKRGDIKNLKNWHPISLLNVDYKIISKVLTSRLAKVLESIVNPDQTCSVPGRSIFLMSRFCMTLLIIFKRLMNALFLSVQIRKKPSIESTALFFCNYSKFMVLDPPFVIR